MRDLISDYYEKFFISSDTRSWDSGLFEEAKRSIKASFSILSKQELDWIKDILETQNGRLFIGYLFYDSEDVPESLLNALLLGAARIPDPSTNRYLVEPCVRTFGHKIVLEKLSEIFKDCSDKEKAGIIRAFYWAEPGTENRFDDENRRLEPTTESQALMDSFIGFFQMRREMLLEEFVKNDSLEVRRWILRLRYLTWNEDDYSEGYQQFLKDAKTIAQRDFQLKAGRNIVDE